MNIREFEELNKLKGKEVHGNLCWHCKNFCSDKKVSEHKYDCPDFDQFTYKKIKKSIYRPILK